MIYSRFITAQSKIDHRSGLARPDILKLVPFENKIIIRGEVNKKFSLNKFLMQLMNSYPFQRGIVLSKNSPLNEIMGMLVPQGKYIAWAIRNVKEFTLIPELFDQKHLCHRVKGFNVRGIDLSSDEVVVEFETPYDFLNISEATPVGRFNRSDVMELTPIIVSYYAKLDSNLLTLNANKIKTIASSEPLEESANSEGQNAANSYSKYGGPEINGVMLDDDLIDDAFEGDASNYWNIG